VGAGGGAGVGSGPEHLSTHVCTQSLYTEGGLEEQSAMQADELPPGQSEPVIKAEDSWGVVAMPRSRSFPIILLLGKTRNQKTFCLFFLIPC
jgi:hypothetical protein